MKGSLEEKTIKILREMVAKNKLKGFALHRYYYPKGPISSFSVFRETDGGRIVSRAFTLFPSSSKKINFLNIGVQDNHEEASQKILALFDKAE